MLNQQRGVAGVEDEEEGLQGKLEEGDQVLKCNLNVKLMRYRFVLKKKKRKWQSPHSSLPSFLAQFGQCYPMESPHSSLPSFLAQFGQCYPMESPHSSLPSFLAQFGQCYPM
jgi:hypothetical protein